MKGVLAAYTASESAKRAQLKFEAVNAMQLCDSRRLQEHQLRDKAKNSASSKLALVAEPHKKTLLLFPRYKGGCGAVLGPGEFLAVYAALPESRR